MLIGGLAAGFGAAAGPAFAANGRRVWRMMRGGSDVGSHTLTVSASGGRVTMRCAASIRIKVLGITAYRYALNYTETWEGGRLVGLEGKTNDDGAEDFVRLKAAGDQFQIEGSKYTGPAPLDTTPTSYWNYDAAFDGGKWVSTQSGLLYDMSFAKSPWKGGGEQIDASGGFKTRLFYDADREWRGCVFDAGGTDIEYVETEPGPSFRTIVGG